MDYLSEDFLGLGNNKPIASCLKYGLRDCSKEHAGVFIFKNNGYEYDFVPMQNLDQSNPNHFSSDNFEFYKHYLDSSVISLFHTHIIESPDPSDLDTEISESLGIPSYILSCDSKKSHLHYPDSYQPKALYGRIFIPFFQDCITFVKDFYQINLNIKLSKQISNWARDSKESNEKLIKTIKNKFIEVNYKDKKYGDLIVFKPTLSALFHVGVVNENNYFSHHPMGGIPVDELFSNETPNKVYKLYRYKDL